MGAVLAITAPIYLAIALGWGCVRSGVFAPPDLRSLGQFVLRLALPALLFEALTTRALAELLQPGYLLAYAAGSLASMGVMALWTLRQGLSSGERVVRMMGVSCSNSGYVGYPVLMLVLPQVAGTALALSMMVENLLMLPLLLWLGERGQRPDLAWREGMAHAAARVARNPLTLAMAAGLALAITGVSLPGAVQRTVHLFALASTGLSLFVIGGSLVGLPLRGLGQRVAPVVLGKLVLHPLAVALAISALPLLGLAPLEATLTQAAIVLAAVPMLGVYPILAQSLGHAGLAAGALLATTLVSFFSLNALLAWLPQWTS